MRSPVNRSNGVREPCRVALALIVGIFAVAFTQAPAASALERAHSAAAAAGQSAQLVRVGSRGPAVRALQTTLVRLTYLPRGAVDGIFGKQTWHAVVAFQGWSGLSRDGIVGPRTWNALSRARIPVPWSRATGIEIHIAQQVALLVRNGRVQRSIHVATGAGGTTPLGHFRILRREPMSWSASFHVSMPLAQYFYRGYAIHEFADVPAHPASHGCVRVPRSDAREVWRFGTIGMRVWTRR